MIEKEVIKEDMIEEEMARIIEEEMTEKEIID